LQAFAWGERIFRANVSQVRQGTLAQTPINPQSPGSSGGRHNEEIPSVILGYFRAGNKSFLIRSVSP
jgi:hypothetical protein